jgi:regulator of sigma E protease
MEVDSKVKDGFNSKTPFQRFVVLFAGVFMNFLLAFIIIFIMIMASGNVEQSDEPVVGRVLKTSKAYGVLKEGDRFLELKGQEVRTWSDISQIVGNNTSEEVSAKIRRNNEVLDLELELSYDENRKFYMIGILPVYDVEKYSFFKGMAVSFETFVKLFSQTIEGIKMIFSGKVKAEEISGPVGMIKIVGQASKGGYLILVWLTALLSVNIGIFNLLPFPALDGGRIIFVVLEIFGIKVDKKLEEKFHAIGMLFLIFLILLITFNDLKKFF